jgi:septum formation protein
MMSNMKARHHLILASQSPRRSELLKKAGFEFAILPSQISEIPDENLNLPERIRKLAWEKAEAVAKSGNISKNQGNLILSADTVVVLEDQILGKPLDRTENRQFLTRLSGGEHSVITAICLLDVDRGVSVTDHEVSKIWFRSLSEAEIEAYISNGDGLDKAGGYGIQNPMIAAFVERVEGPFDNIVGLPVELVKKVLRENGWSPKLIGSGDDLT